MFHYSQFTFVEGCAIRIRAHNAIFLSRSFKGSLKRTEEIRKLMMKKRELEKEVEREERKERRK